MLINAATCAGVRHIDQGCIQFVGEEVSRRTHDTAHTRQSMQGQDHARPERRDSALIAQFLKLGSALLIGSPGTSHIVGIKQTIMSRDRADLDAPFAVDKFVAPELRPAAGFLGSS